VLNYPQKDNEKVLGSLEAKGNKNVKASKPDSVLYSSNNAEQHGAGEDLAPGRKRAVARGI